MYFSHFHVGGLLLAALLALAPLACSRSSAPDNAAPAASASTAPAAAPASATAAAPAGGPERWTGTYKSAAATMYIPRDADVPNSKDWDGVKFRGDDAGLGLGDGALVLTVDPKTGRAEGTIDGVVGPAVIYGHVRDNRFTATVARKDPTDEGLTGTANGQVAGSKIEGIMRLAESNARVVREAAFTLTKAGP